MRSLEDYGITLDWCELCDGIWLDAGELSRLTQTASDLPTLPPQPNRPLARTGTRPTCTRCNRTMEEIPYGDHENLRVDRCSICHGFWLERSELQAIRDRTRAQRTHPTETPLPPVESDSLAWTVLWILLGIILLTGTALFFVLLNR